MGGGGLLLVVVVVGGGGALNLGPPPTGGTQHGVYIIGTDLELQEDGGGTPSGGVKGPRWSVPVQVCIIQVLQHRGRKDASWQGQIVRKGHREQRTYTRLHCGEDM